MKIGILSDKNNPEGSIIPREVIMTYKLEDDNEIVPYNDYTTMVVDLYEGDLDSLFITDGYASMFTEISGYEDISSKTKVLFSQSKKMRKKDTSKEEVASTGKSVTEPFTLLIMGIDSTDEVLEKNAIAHGDTLILVTFNPKTLNATMLSIPRDSYVPISCWSGKPENKITHAAAYGTDCMIHTIEEYLDTDIDYYAKINFKGLVKLVDSVGGVEVDVKQVLCTDDSGRLGEVCIQPGLQVLDGEHALVYARNRKQLENGDFGRSEHQQEIIKLLMNKIKNLTDVTKFMEILNTVSNSVDTNLTTKQILSFYNIGKDIVLKSLSNENADIVNFQSLFLDGIGQMIYDERAKMVLWDYIPNKNSRRDIVQAMKENLGLESHKMITEFHFSINKPYVQKVIGEGPYNNTVGYELLPDFTGDTESEARATCSKLGIPVTFTGGNGTVINQNYPYRKRVDLIKDSLVLTLSGSSRSEEVIKKKIDKDEDDEKEKEE
ncbi:MAG: LCP family protein, partial [Bacilli bacterium]|nr:LCP family protein [Bacilli bacterium]